MSIEKAKAYLRQFGAEDRVIEFPVSSATVELAAEAAHCEPARIAKTLSFRTNDGVILIVATGDTKIDNPKYKARFGCNSYLISQGIVRLVKKALHTECWRDNTRPDVLVIVPPSITPEYDHLMFKDAMGTGCHERCAGIAAQLEPLLKDIAHVRFLDANTLPGAGCSPLDGMHMTVQSHKVLARALQKELTGDTL